MPELTREQEVTHAHEAYDAWQRTLNPARITDARDTFVAGYLIASACPPHASAPDEPHIVDGDASLPKPRHYHYD